MEKLMRTITICQNCRRRLFRIESPGPSGAWYHRRNASVFCRPGQGRQGDPRARALPREIEVRR